MISTRRGLAVLLAIAAVLGMLLVRELRRTRPPAEDRALVPGLDPNSIRAMTWERSPLPAVTVSGAGTQWVWSSTTSTAQADSRVVRDVLAALRAGRWQRTAEVGAAGKLRTRLSLTIGTATRGIGIGEALPGTEQTWIVVGERALLVDSWVARALDPDPLALRERRPVADATHAQLITIDTRAGALRFEGSPRRQVQPRILLVRTELMAELSRALEAIEIVRLSRPPAENVDDLVISLAPTLRLADRCPDDPSLAWLSSDLGDGCIPRTTYDAVFAAARALAGPAETVAEPRLLAAELDKVVLPDRRELELERAPSIDGKPADPVAVAELLAVLAAPAELVATPPGAIVRARLSLAVHGGTMIVLELLGNGLVRREGEGLSLRISGGAYERLARTGQAYADKTVWSEEPTMITSIKIDAVTYTRGAVIGDWTRAAAGTFDPKLVEAVVLAVSAPRLAPEVGSLRDRYTHHVVLTVTPPVGAPVVHELAVRNAPCTATNAAGTMSFAPAVCEALDALVR